MIATLAKRFTFDAAHCLPKLGPDHKCHRLHGHTYEVELVFRGRVQENGFVVDYDKIAEAWQPIHDELDHRYLNDVPGLETPSTEVLCGWMWKRLEMWNDLVKIHIKESSTTWCEMTRAEYDPRQK
jgi:6-pyruvoyltetrahydropterin/6-carboxytetrahydropterin synthase